jgi:phosphoserine phosphatase RsbU/P
MKKAVILCVDDEKMVLTSLKAELKEVFGNQYIIELSEDPNEAIEILENLIEEGHTVPLIISDYIMPNMKGDELLKHLHVLSPKTLSIMLTGQATTEGVTNAVNWARLYRYIGKPWETKDLSMTVQEAIKSFDQTLQLELQNQELKALNEDLEKKVEERTWEIIVKSEILEQQKEELDTQNKSITDSIRAAFKIQKALLPTPEILNRSFPNHFVLFKPKDIVSGDFFWFRQMNDIIYFAAADCTGHGVPGALMSMLGISFLNEIVADQTIKSPAEILCELRSKIKTLLKQDGRFNEPKDGLDIAFCSINVKTKTIQYSGAYNPLFLIRKNKETSVPELLITKGDRMPIGVYPTDFEDFTNHEIVLEDCDSIYIFSDGFTSQFGGTKGRKMRSKDFRELLLNIQHLSMEEQKNKLDEYLMNWQNEHSQVDDILVVGVKICDNMLNPDICNSAISVAEFN